ncbi:hypothetical protein [Methanofollis tationis]|nr:hypothetical protein [Methanofollis tationis]
MKVGAECGVRPVFLRDTECGLPEALVVGKTGGGRGLLPEDL